MRDSVYGGATAWHAAAVAGAICLGATFPRVQPGRADEVAAREQSVPSLERSDYYEGDGLADVPSPVREALEAWINAEFALERPATPETFATGFVDALAAREDAPIVHRLAIDDDLDVFAAALEAYPSGVCTDAFEEDLLVDGVPRYYLVRGGKVVEHGVVDEDRIATWRAMYAP